MPTIPRSPLVKKTFHALASATTERECDSILADFRTKMQPGDWGDLESWVLEEFTPKHVPRGVNNFIRPMGATPQV